MLTIIMRIQKLNKGFIELYEPILTLFFFLARKVKFDRHEKNNNKGNAKQRPSLKLGRNKKRN